MVAVAQERRFGKSVQRSFNAYRTNQANWLTLDIGGQRVGLSPSRVYDMDTGRFLQRDPLPRMALLVSKVGKKGLGIWSSTKFAREFVSRANWILRGGAGILRTDPWQYRTNQYQYLDAEPSEESDAAGFDPPVPAEVTNAREKLKAAEEAFKHALRKWKQEQDYPDKTEKNERAIDERRKDVERAQKEYEDALDKHKIGDPPRDPNPVGSDKAKWMRLRDEKQCTLNAIKTLRPRPHMQCACYKCVRWPTARGTHWTKLHDGPCTGKER